MKALLLGVVLACTISLPLDAQTTDREWQEEAAKRFPEIAVKDSPLNKMFLAEYSRLKQSTPDFFRNNANWPVIIATQCSAQLSRLAVIPGLEDAKDETEQLRQQKAAVESQQAKAAAEKQDAFAAERSKSIEAAKSQFPASTDMKSELAQAIVAHIEAITNDPVRRVILNDPKAPEIIAYEAAMQVARRRGVENGTSIAKELSALMERDAPAKAAAPAATVAPAARKPTTAVLPPSNKIVEPNPASTRDDLARRQAELDRLFSGARPERPRTAAEVHAKLNAIIFPKIDFRDATLSECAEFITAKSKTLDPQGVGVSVLIAPSVPPSKTGVRLTLTLKDVPQMEVLKYIVSLSGLQYRIDGAGITILPK